jgi:hypothetical protein
LYWSTPALFQLQMPAVLRLLADGGQDTRWLTALDNADHCVGLGVLEVRNDKLVAAPHGSIEDRDIPPLRSVLGPVVKLRGDVAQYVTADGIHLAIGVEETDDPLFLLERLNDAIEQDAVEAAIVEPDAMLMVLAKGVHVDSSVVRYLEP